MAFKESEKEDLKVSAALLSSFKVCFKWTLKCTGEFFSEASSMCKCCLGSGCPFS